MKNNLKGELAVMDSLDIKPNYAALGRKYGMDWRTVKKYHNGYEGEFETIEELEVLISAVNKDMKVTVKHIFICHRKITYGFNTK